MLQTVRHLPHGGKRLSLFTYRSAIIPQRSAYRRVSDAAEDETVDSREGTYPIPASEIAAIQRSAVFHQHTCACPPHQRKCHRQ